MSKLSFNHGIYCLIFLVAGLNYALMLGTLELVTGSHFKVAALDLLRTESSFFLFVGFLSSCFLINTPRFLWLRRMLVLLLALITLSLAHMAAVLAQITSEAGPMHKVLFYVNYISSDWLTPTLFQFFVLYLFPISILFIAWLIYSYCLPKQDQNKALRKKYLMRFCLGILFLLIGFIPPLQNQMPYSLSHNALIYLVKTGYFPQKDIITYEKNSSYQDWLFDQKTSLDNPFGLRKKNILLIILESTQYKAIQLSDDSEFPGLTPTLNKLSKHSLVFTQAFGSVPHTSKALTSIHCGILPVLDLPIYASIYGLPVTCLPKLLHQKGYDSVFMQGATDKYENRRELLRQFGYQTIYSAEDFIGADGDRGNPLGFEDKVLVDEVAKWLKDNPEKNFLMSLLNLTTHHPYTLPEAYRVKDYVDDPLENDYLNSIRYMDNYIGKLMAEFEKDPRYKDTLFVFVSDHGESFGEHGEQLHNNVAYNEVSQVFFMIFDPASSLEVGRKSTTVSQLQILPTVLDLIGSPIMSEHESFQMQSVFKESGKAFGACYERFMCFFYASNDYKYIYNFREKLPELYHIKNDPQEQNNLVSSESSITEKMHQTLIEYYSKHQSSMHTYYSSENPLYQQQIDKTVLYTIDDMKNSLSEIWP